MEATLTSTRYSGRVFDAAALEQVRGILRTHAGASRQQLSYRVCEALHWRKPDGSLKANSWPGSLTTLRRAAGLGRVLSVICTTGRRGPPTRLTDSSY